MWIGPGLACMHIKRVPLRGRRATGVQDWRQKDRNLAAIHAPNVFGDQADKHVKSRLLAEFRHVQGDLFTSLF